MNRALLRDALEYGYSVMYIGLKGSVTLSPAVDFTKFFLN